MDDIEASRQDGVKIFGRSLGTAPAIHLASKFEVGGLILVSPFTSHLELDMDVFHGGGD